MTPEKSERLKSLASVISILSVVIGVVISVWNFSNAKEKEAEARKLEAAKAFLDLRLKTYLEAIHNASILATPDAHDSTEVKAANKRFNELYWGEMALVEDTAVDNRMVDFNKDRSTINCINLAKQMRSSLFSSWHIDSTFTGVIFQ